MTLRHFFVVKPSEIKKGRSIMTMKRRIISLFLILMLVAVTATCAFAESTHEDSVSATLASEDAVSIETIRELSGIGIQPPVLKSNRYYTTTVSESLGSCNIHVSKKEARNAGYYEKTLKYGAGAALSAVAHWAIATLAGVAVNEFYTNPTHAAGDYSISSYLVKVVEKDRLTGKTRSVLSRSYKFKMSHKGKTKTFVFPFK